MQTVNSAEARSQWPQLLERVEQGEEVVITRHGVAVARLVPEKQPPQEESAPKPRTGRELLEAWEKSGLVGLWKDRTDIGDSSEYAAKLRRQAEERSRG